VVVRSRALGLEAPYNEALCAVLRVREAGFAQPATASGSSQ
jgi:hypothetical protein